MKKPILAGHTIITLLGKEIYRQTLSTTEVADILTGLHKISQPKQLRLHIHPRADKGAHKNGFIPADHLPKLVRMIRAVPKVTRTELIKGLKLTDHQFNTVTKLARAQKILTSKHGYKLNVLSKLELD